MSETVDPNDPVELDQLDPASISLGPVTSERSLRELLFLQRLSRAAASTLSPDELLELIITETTEAMGSQVCSLYLSEETTGELLLTATNGLSQAAVGRASVKMGEQVTGWVALHRQPLVVDDVTKEPRFQFLPGVDDRRFRSMLSVPIESGPRLVGVLNAQAEPIRQFTGADVDFMVALAGQVAGILERSELQRRQSLQLKEIQISHDIHQRFTRLALSGAGLESILDTLEALSASHVGLYDYVGYRLRPAQGASSQLAQRLHFPGAVRHPRAADQPRATTASVGRPARQLTMIPLLSGDLPLAVLVATEGTSEVSAADRMRALEHGATVIALELAKERAAAEVERRLRGDLMEDLLQEGLDPAQLIQLSQRAERLGYRIAAASWAVVIGPDTSAGQLLLAEASFQDSLHRGLSQLCETSAVQAQVSTRSSSALVMLAQAGQGAVSNLEGAVAFATAAIALANNLAHGPTFSAGISNASSAIAQWPWSYRQARTALKLGRLGDRSGSVTTYRTLGPLRLLADGRREEIQRFVEETLGALLEYQRNHSTPLLKTAATLVEANFNRRAASRMLKVHINSLLYRWERIEELCGLDLDDPDCRMELTMALKARALVGEPD